MVYIQSHVEECFKRSTNMIYKTVEEMKDENFQKWWAHHPWRVVCVDNKKLFHINIMLVFAAILSGCLALGITGLAEGVKYKQYKKAKSELAEKKLKEKYSKTQIARFETYSMIHKKIKQK